MNLDSDTQGAKSMGTQYMVHPQKWRDTCDPFAFDYNNFQPKEILGYPHAGNDVFHVRGLADNSETTAYIKAARQKGAAIDNEVNILAQLKGPVFPKVLDYDRKHGLFSVTSDMPGLRLSTIAGDNRDLVSSSYMEEYGDALGRLHKLHISAKPQVDRKFYHPPTEELLEKLNLLFLEDFFHYKPTDSKTVFCHGDFHYANVLWKDHHISAILDFELAGYGNRDFDIAWALFLRPGQKFLKTDQERDLFLKGYQRHDVCNVKAVKYYMAQCYVYFLCFSKNDEDYCGYVRKWLEENCKG